MLIAAQIRAARSSLGWSAEELAKHSSVSRRTIVSIESGNGVPPVNLQTLMKLKAALETAGIEFIGSPEDAPGIRIHPRPAAG